MHPCVSVIVRESAAISWSKTCRGRTLGLDSRYDDPTMHPEAPQSSKLRRALLIGTVIALGALFFLPAAQATIAEQRARLPPPATCEDPVEGVWKSHQYVPFMRQWMVFTLEIRRVKGSETALAGRISNHAWDGSPQEQEPGPCKGLQHWVVSFDGRGWLKGRQIFFGGQGRWHLDQVLCAGGPGGYNLDNFSGEIDPELQEFQTVNNDGGLAVNIPTVFRRIRCFDPGSPPHIEVAPPPLMPDRSKGCGW